MAPSVARAVEAVRGMLRASGWLADALLALDVRQAIADGHERVLVTLVVDEERAGSEVERRATGQALLSSEIAGVAVSTRARARPQLLGGAPSVIAGAEHVLDEVAGVTHRATHGAFVQAHRGQAAKLHAAIEKVLREALGGLEGKSVLDLYGGSGAIGLALAGAGARVTLVESFAPAAAAARQAGLHVVTGSAATLNQELMADAIVVNPPRRGLDPKTRRAIAKRRPRAVVYVSCNPETLARDLADFSRLGLAAAELVPLDMIPLSDHVEVLATLRPKPPEPPRMLAEQGDWCAVEKPAHEPTTPQGEHESSLLDRVRSRAGWEQAVPLHRLDSETSGVCLFARNGPAAGRLQPRLVAATKRYVALVRGVTQERGVVRRPVEDADRPRPSRTRYVRLALLAGHSLLDVCPEQGRKHQIRRHLAGIGHPVVGDRRYGHAPTNRHFQERHGLDRCFLHLQRIELPLEEGPTSVECELSPDLAALSQKLGEAPERWDRAARFLLR
jgi:23S rRNA (uracil1939-C5)-methyltransferase